MESEENQLSARELLKMRQVEISLDDHRTPEEIVQALGLIATTSDVLASQSWHSPIPVRPVKRSENWLGFVK